MVLPASNLKIAIHEAPLSPRPAAASGASESFAAPALSAPRSADSFSLSSQNSLRSQSSFGSQSSFAHESAEPRTLTAALQRAQVPDHQHWVWFGKPLPSEHLENIIEARGNMLDGKAVIWTDKAKSILHAYGSHNAGAIERRLQALNIEMRHPDELLAQAKRDGLPARDLQSALARELHGTYRNYAAASDITRLLALRKGGIYRDVDVVPLRDEPQSPYGHESTFTPQPLYAPSSKAHANVFAKFNNCVLAAPKDSPVVDAALKSIATSYRDDANTWTGKRSMQEPHPEDILNDTKSGRVYQTVKISGPMQVRAAATAEIAKRYPQDAEGRILERNARFAYNDDLAAVAEGIPLRLITGENIDTHSKAWCTPQRVSYDDNGFAHSRAGSRGTSFNPQSVSSVVF